MSTSYAGIFTLSPKNPCTLLDTYMGTLTLLWVRFPRFINFAEIDENGRDRKWGQGHLTAPLIRT